MQTTLVLFICLLHHYTRNTLFCIVVPLLHLSFLGYVTGYILFPITHQHLISCTISCECYMGSVTYFYTSINLVEVKTVAQQAKYALCYKRLVLFCCKLSRNQPTVLWFLLFAMIHDCTCLHSSNLFPQRWHKWIKRGTFLLNQFHVTLRILILYTCLVSGLKQPVPEVSQYIHAQHNGFWWYTCVCSQYQSGLHSLGNICWDNAAEHEIVCKCNKKVCVDFPLKQWLLTEGRASPGGPQEISRGTRTLACSTTLKNFEGECVAFKRYASANFTPLHDIWLSSGRDGSRG